MEEAASGRGATLASEFGKSVAVESLSEARRKPFNALKVVRVYEGMPAKVGPVNDGRVGILVSKL